MWQRQLGFWAAVLHALRRSRRRRRSSSRRERRRSSTSIRIVRPKCVFDVQAGDMDKDGPQELESHGTEMVASAPSMRGASAAAVEAELEISQKFPESGQRRSCAEGHELDWGGASSFDDEDEYRLPPTCSMCAGICNPVWK
ncbi:unnamed protein product [Prorocentrum cordatum]|uniref:Uncharacterized protein n=1 Tax=Prorocentrum cordatum TaxID=2364126 RepID=A0ABN9Q3H9_9DINO|nr:unnamed protein product [Polarella glacialis]